MGVKGEKKGVKKAAAREARKAAKEELRNKQIVATRNAAAKHVLNNAIVKTLKPRINWYLVELLDPSRWEEAVTHGLRGIPDYYSHRGHIFCTRTFLDLGATNFDSTGKCNIVVRPSLNQHVARTLVTPARNSYGYGWAENWSGDGLQWFNPVDANDQFSGQHTSVAAGGALVAYPPSSLDCASSAGAAAQICNKLWPDGPATTAVGNHGNYAYSFAAAVDNIVRATFLLHTPFPVGVTGTMTLEVTDDVGVTSTSLAAVAGHSTGYIVHTMHAAATKILQARLLNNTNGTLLVKNFGWTLTVTRPATHKALVADDAQNFTRIKTDFSAYRPVCGYLWPKYRGDLTKSGNIAGALIDSSATPTITGVTDYDTLAGLLHAHEGNIVNGGYGIWAPMNPNDTNFLRPEDLRENAPFLMAALDINDVAAQSIRVEVFFVWEALTQLQMYAPEPGSVDPEMMADAFAKLAHFDKFMENDMHLKAIAAFLTGAMKKGQQIYGDIMAHPAGKAAVSSAARLLMSKAQAYGPAVANAAKMALAAASAL